MSDIAQTDFAAFIEAGWADHGERADEVAGRLVDAIERPASAAELLQLARLAAHVFGEHLGRWQRGIELLEGLRCHPVHDGSAAMNSELARHIGALRHAGNLPEETGPAWPGPSPEERVGVLASAAAMLAGQLDFRRAIGAYDEALRRAGCGLPEGSAACRALAIGGNNLAAALEEKPDRDGFETRGMVSAAEGGLLYWKRVGTWLEEERAEYRLARSLLQASLPDAASLHARLCLEVCSAHGAPAIEQFFGHAALALAQRRQGDSAAFEASRALALQCHELAGPDEKS